MAKNIFIDPRSLTIKSGPIYSEYPLASLIRQLAAMLYDRFQIFAVLFALLSLLCSGLGYLWRLIRPYTWHDRLSHTRIIDISSLASSEKKVGADPQ
ncbi:MAG: hypothetical protein GY815_17900 [Gammaproteobacteria bacterium]|nr:hypothetical protein [Gammaproteobacteria bacterium]